MKGHPTKGLLFHRCPLQQPGTPSQTSQAARTTLRGPSKDLGHSLPSYYAKNSALPAAAAAVIAAAVGRRLTVPHDGKTARDLPQAGAMPSTSADSNPKWPSGHPSEQVLKEAVKHEVNTISTRYQQSRESTYLNRFARKLKQSSICPGV